MKNLTVRLPQNYEVGAVQCSDGAWGPMGRGSHDDVVVPISCAPGATPTTVWHTHPDGIAEPSTADMDNARSAGIRRVCVTVPATGETNCRNT